MSIPATAERCRWWVVIGYEVSMFRGLPELGPGSITAAKQRSAWLIGNSITETRVLHTRNLCDFCTSKDRGDIKPSDLFDNYNTESKYNTLRGLMKQLDQQYGMGNDAKSARWAFNKKLAHPTKERGKGFDYAPFLNRVDPVLEKIIAEIETLRGCPFPS